MSSRPPVGGMAWHTKPSTYSAYYASLSYLGLYNATFYIIINKIIISIKIILSTAMLKEA